MNVSPNTIKRILNKAGYTDSDYNVMTIIDGLQWEDREDYDTIEDAVLSVIEESVNLVSISTQLLRG